MIDLIAWLLVGLVAGAVARLVLPGEDPMGILGTMVLGLIGSILGALVALLIYRTVAGRRGTV